MTARTISSRQAGVASADGGRDTSNDPHTLFLLLATTYVALQSVSSVTGTGLLRALTYVVALVMPAIIAINTAGRREQALLGMGITLSLLLYYYGLIGSVALNYQKLDWGVAAKLLLAPLFLVLGARVESRCSHTAQLTPKTLGWLAVVTVLPLAVLALQLVKGVNVFARGADFSVFTNRNNAALFAVALLALFTVVARRPLTNVFIYRAVGASFGTLGVLIAIVFSLLVLVANRENVLRYTTILLVLTASMILLAIYDVWIFARFKPVIGTLELLMDPRVNFPALSYERLYRVLHTTDLSLAFRIKHWHDLLDIYASAPVYNWLFGLGAGKSIVLSYAHLVPHNDFLRVLFEGGVVACAGFASLLAMLLRSLGRRWETVPFLAIVLYMFSENLVDNFLAMAIFYYSGGALAYRLKRGSRPAASPLKTDTYWGLKHERSE